MEETIMLSKVDFVTNGDVCRDVHGRFYIFIRKTVENQGSTTMLIDPFMFPNSIQRGLNYYSSTSVTGYKAEGVYANAFRGLEMNSFTSSYDMFTFNGEIYPLPIPMTDRNGIRFQTLTDGINYYLTYDPKTNTLN